MAERIFLPDHLVEPAFIKVSERLFPDNLKRRKRR